MDEPEQQPEEQQEPVIDDGKWLEELGAMRDMATKAQAAQPVEAPPPEPDPAFEEGWVLRAAREQNLDRAAAPAAGVNGEVDIPQANIPAPPPDAQVNVRAFAQPEAQRDAPPPVQQAVDADFGNAVAAMNEQADAAAEVPQADAAPPPEANREAPLPVEQNLDAAFAEAVGQMGQQAAIAAEAPAAPAGDLLAEVPQEQFVRPERQQGETYVQYSRRINAAKGEFRQQQAARKPNEQFAIREHDPHQVVVQQQGNLNANVPLAMPAADMERLTREGADTARNLGERFKVYLEQQRALNTTMLQMLSVMADALAQDRATLEQIRARFERQREA